jgi:hypothetical protein
MNFATHLVTESHLVRANLGDGATRAPVHLGHEILYIVDNKEEIRTDYIWEIHADMQFTVSNLLSKNLKIKIFKAVMLHVVLRDCETWSLPLW